MLEWATVHILGVKAVRSVIVGHDTSHPYKNREVRLGMTTIRPACPPRITT
jgi:hypothetical protein